MAIRVLLIVGVGAVAAYYLTRGRSPWRDRVVVLVLSGVLVTTIIVPQITSVIARRLNVGRGVDLAFYLGFLLLFFLVSVQRIRIREQDRTITTIVRELALLRARPPNDRGSASSSNDA